MSFILITDGLKFPDILLRCSIALQRARALSARDGLSCISLDLELIVIVMELLLGHLMFSHQLLDPLIVLLPPRLPFFYFLFMK